MPQDVDVLQSSGDFSQASSKKEKHFCFLVRVKSSPRLPPSIVPLDHSIINTNSMCDNWMKREQPKTRAVEAHKRDARQVTALEKLKRGSSALEKSI